MKTNQHFAFLAAAFHVARSHSVAFPGGILALYLLRDNPAAATTDIAARFGYDRHAAGTLLRALREAGLAANAGTRPTGSREENLWAITEAGRVILRRIGGESFALLHAPDPVPA